MVHKSLNNTVDAPCSWRSQHREHLRTSSVKYPTAVTNLC